MNPGLNAFLRLFVTQQAALEFESNCLSIGRSLLPDCVIAVLDGAEPTEEYWSWLIEQVEL